MKASLRLRLLAFAMIAIAVVLSGTYWLRVEVGNDQMRSNAIELASKRASQLAELQAHHVEALLLGTDSSLRQFRDALQAGNKQGAQLIAQSVLDMFPGGSVVHLARIDSNGYFEYTTVDLPQPVYVGDRDYFSFHRWHHREDRLFINKPIFSRTAHQWVILITRPIQKNGAFDGAAFISLSPSYFSSMLAKLDLDTDDVSSVMHHDGTFMARSHDLDDALGKAVHIERPPFRPDAAIQGVFRAEGTSDNVARIYAWYKLAAYPLIVTVGLNEKAILAPVEQEINIARMRNAIGIALLLALTLGMSYLLFRASRNQKALEISEQKSREQSQRLEQVIWGTDVGTWEWDFQNKKDRINERWAQMIGCTVDEIRQRYGFIDHAVMAQLVHPDDWPAAMEQMQQLIDGKIDVLNSEFRMLHKDGNWVWVLSRGRVVKWAKDGTPLRMAGTHQDITARKASEEKLQYIAHYDLLTGLPNRALLAEFMQEAIVRCQQQSKSLAVAYLDLDGFKDVNDTYGHDVGDALLVETARRMKASMREADSIARIGGDEFVALLNDLERPQDCQPALDRLLLAVVEPMTVQDKVFQISTSIGVTLYPQDGGDADLLLRHADQAMYHAKQSGKNRYHIFDVDQAVAAAAKQELLEQLARAYEQSEFTLYYQPKVNMRTGEIIGSEALIRWNHPERGLLPPSAFLPVIENHTLSIKLGEWVIETALAQMAEWNSANFNIPISVNIGVCQLQQADFALRLSKLLSKFPTVDPSNIELEILETSALEELTHVSQVMSACRNIGVRFALDDFGTGYSSLTYLKRLPVDVLKIDKTFVQDILDGADNLAIVEGVIGLAQTFHREVIAEGVETVEIGKRLLMLGCELAQGYAIAHPMPASDLPEWIRNWKPDEAWFGNQSADARPLKLIS